MLFMLILKEAVSLKSVHTIGHDQRGSSDTRSQWVVRMRADDVRSGNTIDGSSNKQCY